MGRPCYCDREGCRLCWLAQHDPEYQQYWGLAPDPPLAPLRSPCAHLGHRVWPPEAPDGLREWRQCEKGHGLVCSCGVCKTCTDYEPDDVAPFGPVGARHLVYHLLPVAGNRVWRRGVDELRQRWELFTGVKVIAIATGANGHPLDPPTEVRDYLPSDCEVLEVLNDPALREVASWLALWERVLGAVADDDAVLFAHSKGVTRPGGPDSPCHRWASLAYRLHLDHWPTIAGQLTRYPITGAFKKRGRGFANSASAWHYSGSFFWARTGDFRARPWRGIEQKWFGAESWPGLAYHPDESGCLFHEGTITGMDLYKPSYWTEVVEPAYAEWVQSHLPGTSPELEADAQDDRTSSTPR